MLEEQMHLNEVGYLGAEATMGSGPLSAGGWRKTFAALCRREIRLDGLALRERQGLAIHLLAENIMTGELRPDEVIEEELLHSPWAEHLRNHPSDAEDVPAPR